MDAILEEGLRGRGEDDGRDEEDGEDAGRADPFVLGKEVVIRDEEAMVNEFRRLVNENVNCVEKGIPCHCHRTKKEKRKVVCVFLT